MNTNLNNVLPFIKTNEIYEFLCVCKICRTPFVVQNDKSHNIDVACQQCGAKKVKVVCELSKELETA